MRLRPFLCRQCGGPVSLQDGSESAACPHCGATIQVDHALAEERARAQKHPNPTPVRLGMKGRFGSAEYEVIARVVLSMVEEGETCFWQEFQMVSPDGAVAYLEYDEGKWSFMEKFTPLRPVGPAQAAGLRAGSSLVLEDVPATVTEVGTGQVRHLEGELTWAARVGDRVNYLDAKRLARHYSIEWTEDAIEFYRGRPLSDRDVFSAFGLKQELDALEGRERARRSRSRFAVACLILSLLSFMWWLASFGSGRLLGENTAQVAQLAGDGMRFGPIQLDPSRRVHRLEVRASLSSASAWVAGVVEAADGEELFAAQGDFWDESGHDSDGYWHESYVRSSTNFVVTQPGACYVRLYAEPDTPGARNQTAGFRLLSGVIHPAYPLAYGIAALVVSILFFCAANPEKLKELAESASDD